MEPHKCVFYSLNQPQAGKESHVAAVKILESGLNCGSKLEQIFKTVDCDEHFIVQFHSRPIFSENVAKLIPMTGAAQLKIRVRAH